jgi:phosphoserine phosphatase
MKYRAIIFDIDGVIVKPVSSWRYLHETLRKWDALACRYQEAFLSGAITYREFCELDASHWKGMKEEELKEIFKTVPFMKNALTTLWSLKKRGFELFAISTGLHYVPQMLKEHSFFRTIISNALESKNGILTGQVVINISHGEKGEIAASLLKEHRISPEEAISVGDSEGDIPVAELCGYAIAFNATSIALKKKSDLVCTSTDLAEIYAIALNLIGEEK